MQLTRREFVAATVTGLSGSSLCQPVIADNTNPAIAIVDTHTHFYDPTRPIGIPWPPKTNALLYRPVLPTEFKTLTKPMGVIGTIIVEASPWLEDNQWLLDLAANDPTILGIVGHLAPGTDSFGTHLARFAKNPLYRGIRIGAGMIKEGMDQPQFLGDLRTLIDADLELDINGGPETLPLINQLADRLPQLRIVINHLSNLTIDGKLPPASWVAGLKSIASHPNVYLKVSALLEHAHIDGQKATKDTEFYRPVLQAAWYTFGEDRLVYGSNWPVSDVAGPYRLILQIVTDFFREQGVAATKKFFLENSKAAYRWRART